MTVRSPRKRLLLRSGAIFSLLIFAGFGLSTFSLVNIQFVKGEEYRAKAEMRQLLDQIVPAKRGTIYDINGKVLAESAAVWKIYINPKRISQIKDEEMREKFREELVNKLSSILEEDEEKVRALTYLENKEYAEVKTKVELAQKEQVVALRGEKYKSDSTDDSEKGISYSLAVGILPDEKRYYPYGNFASGVLGFCGKDAGSYGLERTYETTLKGTPGRVLTVKNADSDAIPLQIETYHKTINGANLVLTIDENIQNPLESKLEKLLEESKGKGAFGIVMDVKTGAVLAMAGKPDYDLNTPYTLTDRVLAEEILKIEDETARKTALSEAQFSQWKNYCTQYTYEPGSVFKSLLTAAAVEEKMWSLSETYTCVGRLKVGGTNGPTISCHKPEGHGALTLKQALVKSCNPFFITVGQRLGKDVFMKYFEAFGFTEKTGVELDESAPTYHDLRKKGIIELSSSSFGQSFEVTPLQVITAISAIANGGKLMQPYIIAKQLDDAGNIMTVTQPTVRRQVISATTAATVTDMMQAVVTDGSGSHAYVAGYQVAGKTGTSQKLNKPGAYVASFACFAPAYDPKIAVLILVDEPVGEVGGSQIAAPVAGEIVESTLKHLNIEPRYSQNEFARLNKKTPKIIGKTVADAKLELEQVGLAIKIIGTGAKVTAQYPAFDQNIPSKGVVILYTDENYQIKKTTVPDFTGKSIEEVYKIALEAGINVKVTGNIQKLEVLTSYKQSVAQDNAVEMGSEIIVSFKSNTVTAEAGG